MENSEKKINTMLGDFSSKDYANIIEAISHKLYLSVNEASVYFGISTSTIRQHLNYNPKCNFGFKNGKKWIIDKNMMRNYIVKGYFAKKYKNEN